MKLIEILKKTRNKRIFNNHSTRYKTLMIASRSNCILDNKKNIVICEHTEILGTLCSVVEGSIIGCHSVVTKDLPTSILGRLGILQKR